MKTLGYSYRYYGIYVYRRRTGLNSSMKKWYVSDYGSNHEESYDTEREAERAADKILIQRGITNKLNILKPKPMKPLGYLLGFLIALLLVYMMYGCQKDSLNMDFYNAAIAKQQKTQDSLNMVDFVNELDSINNQFFNDSIPIARQRKEKRKCSSSLPLVSLPL